MTGRRFWRATALGLAALAVFSILFSLAAWRHVWPELPPGAFHNTDQWLGLAGGLVILLLLLRPRRTTED
jgi:hypothetical protein